MQELNPQEIERIKSLSSRDPLQDLVLNAGDGILINGSGKSWSISIDPEQSIKNLQTATIQVCIDGTPVRLDVYIKGSPY